MAHWKDWVRRNTTVNKPAAAASNEGMVYYDTTLNQLQRSSGATWESIEGAGASTASVTVATDTLWAAKGDLAVATADDAATILTVGANNTLLVASSGETVGLKWAAQFAAINIPLESASTAAISTGLKGGIEVPFACTVTAWTLGATDGNSGAMVVDVWKDSYANFPPTDADAMPGAGNEPTIAGTATKGQDTDASNWSTTTISAGDWLFFNVDSCTTITRATLSLKVQRTY